METVVLHWGQFYPQRTLARSGDISGCQNAGRGALLLAPSEWRPGVLLDVLQCTQWHLLPGNYPAPNVSNVEVERLHLVVSNEDQRQGFPLPPGGSHLLQVGLTVHSLPSAPDRSAKQNLSCHNICVEAFSLSCWLWSETLRAFQHLPTSPHAHSRAGRPRACHRWRGVCGFETVYAPTVWLTYRTFSQPELSGSEASLPKLKPQLQALPLASPG